LSLSRPSDLPSAGVSEETRRAYARSCEGVFAAIGNPAPMAVTVAEMQVASARRCSAAKAEGMRQVAFKLNDAARLLRVSGRQMGMLEKNPADVRFVIPPRLPSLWPGAR
jgi:hypothetical protein